MTYDELETYWKLVAAIRSELSEMGGHILMDIWYEAASRRLADRMLAFFKQEAHNGPASGGATPPDLQ